MRLELGTSVRCEDGEAARLVDVVLDAQSRAVTHLVVEPPGDLEPARLVPLALAEGGDEDVSLGCTADALKQLEQVREYAYVRPGEELDEDPKWDVGVEDMVTAPHYGPADFGEYATDLDMGMGVAYDRVPKGEVELRKASSVYSADRHHLGHVEGLVVGPDGGISGLLLQRGRLWWRREIAVPVDAVEKLENDQVTLAVPKSELASFTSRKRRGATV